MLLTLAGEVGDKYGTEQVDLKHLIYIAVALLVGTAAVIHKINKRKDFYYEQKENQAGRCVPCRLEPCRWK